VDITHSVSGVRTWSSSSSLRQWVRRGIIAGMAAFIIWDLVMRFMDGPTITFFFPRLFLWVFLGCMAILVWSTFKTLHDLRWKLAFVLLVALGATIILVGPTDSFPFRAPGQDVTVNERTKPLKPISANVLGFEVRPASLDNWIDAKVAWMVAEWRSYFQTLRNGLNKGLVPLEKGLISMPWWLFIGSTTLISWRLSGYKIALIALIGLTSIGLFGLWDNAMRTMAVVGTATAMSVGLAIPVGILMSKSDRLQSAMRPILDLMQVMPAFVYLIPAIYFLGLGKVPAVMATMIYAVPPAMRLTNLGIRLVSPELIEAAKAFGTTPWQLLVKIELPLARPTIMAGVNQTIMMSLAMVVVASMVGAKGLGADVLAGIAQLEFGRGLLGGIGIVILAIIIDRTSQGLAKDPRSKRSS
jgi:glycine betaine/proline transport system permease protein